MQEVEVKEMTQERFDEIVEAVHKELLNAPEEERAMFLFSGLAEHKLIDYHHTLGRHIRNKYSLWNYKWTPVYDDRMVDHSEWHPDNISMKIIKALWLKGNG